MARHGETIRELREPTRSLRHAIPETWAGFTGLHDAAMAEGDVPTRLKEAMALAISVVKRCDGCIAYHAKAAARRRGDARARWPSCSASPCSWTAARRVSYAPRAWEAFGEFRVDDARFVADVPGGGRGRPRPQRGHDSWTRRPAATGPG